MLLRDSIILLTGGAGFLGSGISKKLIEENPSTIRIFDNNEYLLNEMDRKFGTDVFHYILGDIKDKDTISRALNNVDYVFHCAAIKHVPIAEHAPMEAVKTNILGTMNVINSAIDNKVKKPGVSRYA